MKIVYKGNRPIAIPNVGEFKPHEPIEVEQNLAHKLIKEVPGFARYEKASTRKKSDIKTTEVKHDANK